MCVCVREKKKLVRAEISCCCVFFGVVTAGSDYSSLNKVKVLTNPSSSLNTSDRTSQYCLAV